MGVRVGAVLEQRFGPAQYKGFDARKPTHFGIELVTLIFAPLGMQT
jgi:hypothetical protein